MDGDDLLKAIRRRAREEAEADARAADPYASNAEVKRSGKEELEAQAPELPPALQAEREIAARREALSKK